MAFLQTLHLEDEEDFTKDAWFTEYGPFGVSGYNSDGRELGCVCSLCKMPLEASSISGINAHFKGRRHQSKLRQFRSALTLETNTTCESDDVKNKEEYKELSSEDKAALLAKRRKEIETQMSEEEAKRQRLQSELKSIESELGKI